MAAADRYSELGKAHVRGVLLDARIKIRKHAERMARNVQLQLQELSKAAGRDSAEPLGMPQWFVEEAGFTYLWHKNSGLCLALSWDGFKAASSLKMLGAQICIQGTQHLFSSRSAVSSR